ncbi:MAG: PRC-barrel domain-containing protein [Candidatus Portnoybacteria bacterium]
MFIRGKKIIGSKVLTKSGYYLGRVVDFKLDTNGQSITEYHVIKGFFILIRRSLIIKSSQVVEIRKREIIVDDALVPALDMEYAQ